MTKNQRIDAFAQLGNLLQDDSVVTDGFLEQVSYKNPWFTIENTRYQISQIAIQLNKKTLTDWLSDHEANENTKTVGLILAGNIPLVGFHDILSCAIMGFNVKIKASSDDGGLTKFVLDLLYEVQPLFKNKIHLVDKLSDFDLTIATGSNNSARYFEYYFGNKPHIIRKNRNSLALLSGNESSEQLKALGEDIFMYFGLGCRSVSKLYIPQKYNLHSFFEAIEEKSTLLDHFKYRNNYEYNKSIYLINGDKHLDNGFLLIKEDQQLASPLAVVNVERYTSIEDVKSAVQIQKDLIQCIVSDGSDVWEGIETISFGQSQSPSLDEYADNINTLDFLETHK